MNKLKELSFGSRIALIANAALLLVLIVSIVIAVLFVNTPAGMQRRGADELDLRGESLSVEAYEAILEKLPHCEIIWDIPFQGGRVCSTDSSITLTRLTDADVAMLDYMTRLKTVHGENCTDYAQMAQLQRRHPEAQVLYSVPFGSQSFTQDTTSLTLTGLTAEEAANLAYLPQLSSVSISGCTDYSLLQRLQQEHPEWNLRYSVTLDGYEYDWDTTSITAGSVTYEELSNAMAALPQLSSLFLKNPAVPGDQLLQLRQTYPNVDLSWEVEIYGQTLKEDTVELDISGIQVGSCEEVEQLVTSLPNLEKLIMSDCGIDNETMAAFRERQRGNYKVVWTVYLSDKTQCRTDATFFMPIQQGEYYFLDEDSYNLRYCEDIICLDMGHHMIHNIDFVEFMPNLKYLILAHTGVRDVSKLVHCQNLVYLEVDWSEIKDYGPIAELKNLEDLNLNKTYCDITPILKMTWLKNLWAPGRSQAVRQQLIEALPDTRLVLEEPTPEGQGWRNLQNYYDMRDLLGMPYMR